MSAITNPDFAVKLALQLGMTVTDEEIICTGTKGVVYLKVDDVIQPLSNNPDGAPFVCECEHDALALIHDYFKALAVEGMRRILANEDLPYVPEVEELVYVAVVDVEDTTQDQVTPAAKAEADRLLASLMGAV